MNFYIVPLALSLSLASVRGFRNRRREIGRGAAGGMAGKVAAEAAKTVAKAAGEYQYPWREKLSKYKDELSKGVWGYWELGAWKSLSLSARQRARLRKEVLLAGECVHADGYLLNFSRHFSFLLSFGRSWLWFRDWPYDPPRKEMRDKRKGHKCDRISAEKCVFFYIFPMFIIRSFDVNFSIVIAFVFLPIFVDAQILLSWWRKCHKCSWIIRSVHLSFIFFWLSHKLIFLSSTWHIASSGISFLAIIGKTEWIFWKKKLRWGLSALTHVGYHTSIEINKYTNMHCDLFV